MKDQAQQSASAFSRFAGWSPILAIITLSLAGCGGDSSSGGSLSGGGSGGGSGSVITNLDELNGLSGNANNQDLLYFISDVDGNSGLMAVDPAFPSDPPQVVDADAVTHPFEQMFLPIHSGTLSSSGDMLDDFHVDQVFYVTNPSGDLAKGQFATASTEANGTAVTPNRVSSMESARLIGGTRFAQFDLGNPLNTVFMFSTSGDWQQVRLSDDGSTAPDSVPANHQIVVPISDADSLSPSAWLAIDTANNGRVVELGVDLSVTGDVLDGQGQPVSSVDHVNPLGAEMEDGSRYMALTIDDGNTVTRELWRFVPANGGVGTMVPVENANGDRLTFAENLFGPGAAVPPGSRVRTDGQFLYFVQTEGFLIGEGASLVRLDGDSFEILHEQSGSGFLDNFLLLANGRLYWSYRTADSTALKSIATDGSDLEDVDPNGGSAELQTTIFGSTNGWIFYNRLDSTDTAVAMKTDGSQSVEISGARWLGGSSDGTSEVLGLVTELNIEDVFFLRDDGEIGAISASDPANGYVSLGTPNGGTVENATLRGLAPGPHRLMQIEYDGSSPSYEVIYVNTREQDSLQSVSPQVDDSPENKPVRLF